MEVLPIYIESPFLLGPPVSFAKNRDSSTDILWGRSVVSKYVSNIMMILNLVKEQPVPLFEGICCWGSGIAADVARFPSSFDIETTVAVPWASSEHPLSKRSASFIMLEIFCVMIMINGRIRSRNDVILKEKRGAEYAIILHYWGVWSTSQ